MVRPPEWISIPLEMIALAMISSSTPRTAK
jgi:hypothetical protein